MLEVVGMQDLVDKLKKMQDAGKKVGNKALKEAGEIVKQAEIEEAKANHKTVGQGGYSKDIGWKEIKKYNVKATKKGTRVIDIGFRGSGVDWEKAKGLYFNNFGFYHNRTGQYVAGTDWMGKAYDKSVDEAYDTIRESLLKELL